MKTAKKPTGTISRTYYCDEDGCDMAVTITVPRNKKKLLSDSDVACPFCGYDADAKRPRSGKEDDPARESSATASRTYYCNDEECDTPITITVPGKMRKLFADDVTCPFCGWFLGRKKEEDEEHE